jgi:MFS family permease
MAGILQTAFIASYMLFAPLFGYLGDRYSRKAIMAAGVFLWSIFTLIGSLVSGRVEHHGKSWANPDFLAFLACRAMVGIGEASYSTIAPTIISDMFVKDTRSKMLALFYFAIPVGSGMGYIVGSETAKLFGDWHWGLRATPVMGVVAVVLILVLLTDPPRGESEGHADLQAASYWQDLRYLASNKSFILSTFGFTCVTFCTGALSWWGPIFIQRGLETMEPEDRVMEPGSVPFIFGLVTMLSGVVGVPLGMVLSTKLKPKYPRADPIICGVGILISAVFLTLGIVLTDTNIIATFICIFIGEVSLNLNWSIVADILLYVVTPTCRSTAEAVQILISHTFGDAGSPYLIGLVSWRIVLYDRPLTIPLYRSPTACSP